MITPAEKTIIRQLLKCLSIKNREQRDLVLDFLPLDITQNISRGKTDFADVANIVKTCLGYLEGIEQLSYAVYQVEGNTLPWQALEKLLRDIFPRIITYVQLKQLESITAEMGWPSEVLRRAY